MNNHEMMNQAEKKKTYSNLIDNRGEMTMDETKFEYINQRYLSSIADEPRQILQPISGYASEPLLPLEGACEPLLSLVPNLEAHIWVAKQNSKNPPDGLTQDESAAIRLYTMEWDSDSNDVTGSLYTNLNRTLKQVDRTKLRPWFRYLKLFLTALAKLPSAPRQTVWRGIKRDHSVDYPPGAEATWWAFSSCTKSLSVLESDLYLGNVGTRTLFSIEIFNGREIRAHSHFATEDEVLLLPGTFFEVKSRLNPAPDLHIVHLLQKAPPHNLLEPPFEGAELSLSVPSNEIDRFRLRINEVIRRKPWFARKTAWFAFGLVALVLIAGIVPGAIAIAIGSNKNQNSMQMTVAAPPEAKSDQPISDFYKLPKPMPVSAADAFYSFDDHILDIHDVRNGRIVGGSVSYAAGYVAYGKSIVFNKSSTPTYISVSPGFGLSINSNFTIEGFFMLHRLNMNAVLVQLTSLISLQIVNGYLGVSLDANRILLGPQSVSNRDWHHFALVYNGSEQSVKLFIDGSVELSSMSMPLQILVTDLNASMIIGTHYDGRIDQLAVSLRAKSNEEIVWDARTVTYHPFDDDITLDKGPNGQNATIINPTFVSGWRGSGLNFNETNSSYTINNLYSLSIPLQPFSIALWVRAESEPGIFLTIASSATCLLVLGIASDDNSLIAYLPNATDSGKGVRIHGPSMPSYAWAHITFSWSHFHQARLYGSNYSHPGGNDATTLNNARVDENSRIPMSVILGHFDPKGPCQGIQDASVKTNTQFKGSLDQLYVFARELNMNDIMALQKV